MKRKIISLVLALGAIFCLTGCKSEKVLICTGDRSVYKFAESFVYTNGKLSAITIKREFDLSDYTDKMWNNYKSKLKTQNECQIENNIYTHTDYDSHTDVSCKQTIKDKEKHFILTLKVNVEELKKNDPNGMSYYNEIENEKTSQESMGYKCTIK